MKPGEDNKPVLVKALKEMGYKISNIIKLTGVSRASFYKRIDDPPLALLQAIRAVTTPKLDDYFPALKVAPYSLAPGAGLHVADLDAAYQTEQVVEHQYQKLSEEYKALLENHNHLTSLLIKAANNNPTKVLKKAINEFVDKQDKQPNR